MTCLPARDPVGGGLYGRGDDIAGETDVGILLVEVIVVVIIVTIRD